MPIEPPTERPTGPKIKCTLPRRSQDHTFSTGLSCKHYDLQTDALHTESLSVARDVNTLILTDRSQVVQGVFLALETPEKAN